MYTVLSVVQVFIAVILILLVLLHSGKDAGMSGAFGVGVAGGSDRRVPDGAQPGPLDHPVRGPVRREHDRPAEDLAAYRTVAMATRRAFPAWMTSGAPGASCTLLPAALNGIVPLPR